MKLPTMRAIDRKTWVCKCCGDSSKIKKGFKNPRCIPLAVLCYDKSTPTMAWISVPTWQLP